MVYSRLGERRIVPITVTNERRREREVGLELSSFTTKGGSQVPVTGTIVGVSTFTLAACEEYAVIIEVESAATTAGDDTQDRAPLDVDDCVVAVAHLRVTGVTFAAPSASVWCCSPATAMPSTSRAVAGAAETLVAIGLDYPRRAQPRAEPSG